ncbi:Anticodon-binding domain protein [mine drainage metagenome]|uniref:Anticodon-binding domain protein n=1 Tax=mine drainage metagenome TaxID=410659 RepID=T1AP12_9ZZZZ
MLWGWAARLEQAGLRAEVPDRPGERMQAKIRDGELAKVPYLAVVGKREVEAGTVNLRSTRAGSRWCLGSMI